ncbi:hypothetical protein [Zeaxanthinibacter enoshimensis]|uniref:PD-(D/E)XK nuclease superfamily protein n=1 Tax=Zeaxanthinibacter enoshimensis TaxID=392009 RepID=A0A4V3D488_9FLAO|nr:hypothetical protein [Zeaxanthinibacter enoshimensis]TDQ33391.1 hypothetical protein CLV82_1230 [Zeaxanthinibacter enoshimensis]
MGQEISLFNDYRTKENILSNHCGVVLKLLYEENPRSFEEAISNLTSQDFMISPSFKQQIKKKDSTPDIVIEQKSFTIFFETKTFDWFYKNQIDRHLKGFKNDTTYNVLFLLCNFEIDNPEEKFQSQISEAYDRYGITLCPISFETLIGVLETVETTENFKAFLDEFRSFLERNNYLPTWKYMLDIVNCASTIHEVHNHDVYMCPDTGGKYKHRRALFFGGYKSKNVKFIHEIKALVVIEQGGRTGRVVWKNFNDAPSEDLIQEAKNRLNQFDYRKSEIQERDLQVFLLQNPVEVNFRKSSDGGLYSSKKYFRFIAKEHGAKNSMELAEKLAGETWK